MEDQFCHAWQALTAIQRQRGAIGSCLYKADHGTWMAYAQWSNRSAWEQACELHLQDQALSETMLAAVEDTWPPIFLTPIIGQLPPAAQELHVTH